MSTSFLDEILGYFKDRNDDEYGKLWLNFSITSFCNINFFAFLQCHLLCKRKVVKQK